MRKSKFFKIILLLTAVFVSMASLSYGGAVPQTLNYQGTLTDTNGTPTDGTKLMAINLYTTLAGGTAFWTESQTVPVKKGQFSVVLGGVTQNPLDSTEFTGETYIGITVGAGPEMVPRQKLTSVAYALKAADSVPKGVIVMWSGAVDQIPAGWALCDGANGTPNLKDRFVIGAGGTYAVNTTGGSTSHQHGIAANDLNHYHGVYGHTHNYSGRTGDNNNVKGRDNKENTADTPDSPHSHAYSGTTDGGTSHTTNYASEQGFTGLNHSHGGATVAGGITLPPYYALAFIMKIQ